MPNPPRDGGAQVMHFTTLGLLANNVEVKTLAINPTRNFIDVNVLSEKYKNDCGFEFVKVDTTIKLFSLFSNLFRNESYFIERFISKDFDDKLQAILTSQSFDIIQLEHLYLCKYISTIRKYSLAKIILRPQNIEYVIWERFIKNIKNPIKKFVLKININRLKKYEQSVNKELDGIIALTKEDAEIFSSFSDKTPVIVVPMGYDYEKLKNYNFNKQYERSPIVYHLGAMDWLPNTEAIEWFFQKVFPILEEKKSKINISVAGKKMPSWVFKYQSDLINIESEILTPLEYQSNKSILIVPLWSGSGIRAKIIEGLALGKTIISTSIGAQGIEYENGKNMIIADTPEDFANQIINCVNSTELCKEIGKNAKLLSLKNYHFESTAKKMIDFYNIILNHN